MSEYSLIKLIGNTSRKCTKLVKKGNGRGFLIPAIYSNIDTKFYTEGPGKKPPKEEQIDSIKMPGFVHPQTMHDEGYFTQKAKQQLEELKKRMDKPTIENTEKKE